MVQKPDKKMSRNYFISIADVAQESLVGGKAFKLHMLAKVGFDIPSTYCITIHAYEAFIAENQLSSLIQETLGDDSASSLDKSKRIIAKIMDGEIPYELNDELAYNDIFGPQHKKWAVRSSANLEDLSSHSFAGLYDSYLDIKGMGDILSSIKRCWASLWNERAIAYREKNNMNHLKAGMAVIIQEMVDAEYAGVLFTNDPVSGDKDLILMEYCEGLGERLLSGEITPYSCKIHKSRKSIHHMRVPEQKKFGDQDINNLASISLEIENFFNCPQDIEWAFDGEKIYVLQTRPVVDISTYKKNTNQIVWTRANIGEVLPHVITPLTWDVFRATLSNCPNLALEASTDNESVSNGVRLINGYAYVRLDSMLDSFCYLPAVTPEIMGWVLGVNLPSVGQSYIKPNKPVLKLAQIAFILDSLNVFPRLSLLVRQLRHMPDAETEQLREVMDWTSNCFR